MKKIGKMIPFVLGMLTKKPATLLYPFEPAKTPEKSRGKIKFSQDKCIGCKLCMRDCPAKAIEIDKVEDKVFSARIYLDRCIYCAQCVDSCRRGALEVTPEYDLSGFERDKLRVEI